MWLDRLNKIISNEDSINLKEAKVAIIGLGGVGGHALESIVRSGIENIVIIDNDIVDVTNLNRQLLSTTDNIGLKKVDVAKERILSINPNVNIKCIDNFITKDNINLIFDENINYIIDACDTISTKIELIKESLKKNITIISCMGTGNKFNPSMLEIIDIKKTEYDPIAKLIRKKLKEENITNNIDVVCSREIPIETNDKSVGSNSIVPAAAGILCASYIIKTIIKK